MVSTLTEGTGTPWTAVGVAGRVIGGVGAREGGTDGEPVLWAGVGWAGVDWAGRVGRREGPAEAASSGVAPSSKGGLGGAGSSPVESRPPLITRATAVATSAPPAIQRCGGSRGARSTTLLARLPGERRSVEGLGLASGKRSASSVASSLRCRLPRFSHSAPNPPVAASSTSAANARAESGRSAGSLASPLRSGPRIASGTSSTGTGSTRCLSRSAGTSADRYGGRPVRHSNITQVAAYRSASTPAS